MKKRLCFLSVFILVLLSCQKKDPAPIQRVQQAVNVDGVVKYISMSSMASTGSNNTTLDSLTYTSAGRLNSFYRTSDFQRGSFVYNGADISRVNWVFQGNVYYDSVYYSGGLIDSVVRFNTNGKALTVYSKSFKGNLVIQKQVRIPDMAGGDPYATIYYAYDSANNLIQVKDADADGNITYTYNYFYSSTANKLRGNVAFSINQDSQKWPHIIDVISYSPQLPDSVVIINNINTLKYAITYDISANGYPQSVYANNNKFLVFGY